MRRDSRSYFLRAVIALGIFTVSTAHAAPAELLGKLPFSGIIFDSVGNLYGSTEQGGINQVGTLFKIDTSGKAQTLLFFDGNTGVPGALTAGKSGTIFGSTLGGSTSNGTVFKVDSDGTFGFLASFNSPPFPAYQYPIGKLALDAAQNIYGTLKGNGGIVYKLTSSGILTTVATLAYPAVPFGVVTDSSGNLFGESSGGTHNSGTIFQIDSTNTLKILFNFPATGLYGSDIAPYGGLVRDTAGSLYGITFFGGDKNSGSIFKFTTAGIYSTLYSFDGVSSAAPLGLTIDNFGNLFGVALGQSSDVLGIVFKFGTDGVFTTLGKLDRAKGHPVAGLAINESGDIFGVTSDGGKYGFGTVYEIDHAGSFSTIVNFLGVPEPATWSLMLSGFAAIGFRLRHAKSYQARASSIKLN